MKRIVHPIIILSLFAATSAQASAEGYLKQRQADLDKRDHTIICQGYLDKLSLDQAQAKLSPTKKIGIPVSQNGMGQCWVLKAVR